MNALLKHTILFCIRVYRAFAPWLFSFGGLHAFSGCRFSVSCSHYAEAAIIRHGILQGGRMAFWRLAHCHPWHQPSQNL